MPSQIKCAKLLTSICFTTKPEIEFLNLFLTLSFTKYVRNAKRNDSFTYTTILRTHRKAAFKRLMQNTAISISRELN